MANQSASLSDRGRRKNNEDFAAFFEPADPGELKDSGSLYIVADGVGGAAKGERASQFAAQKVLYEYYQPENIDLEPLERLRLILERANDEIYDYASQNNTRMATTIVAAVVRAGFLYVANVGDSRAYLIRDGAAQQINRDHSIVGEMVEHGEMTEADAMISKIKNRITRSLGGDPEVTVEVYPPLQLKTGDKILLCSDGLTRYALREDIAKMTAQGTVEETAQRLVEFANKSGGADNVSVIMTSYQDTSIIEPINRIARPKQVDLDTLDTQPRERFVSKNKTRYIQRPLISRLSKFAPWAIAGFGLVILLCFGVIYIWNPSPGLPPRQTHEAGRKTEVAQKAGTEVANATANALTSQALAAEQQIVSLTQIAVATASADAANQTATAVVVNQASTAAIEMCIVPDNPDKMSTGDCPSIIATNSCDEDLFVFKESGQLNTGNYIQSNPRIFLDPVGDAVIDQNETFKLTSIVKPGIWDGLAKFWLEVLPPFGSKTYLGKGWVLMNSCIKFFQGTSSVTLNTDTLLFETPIPNP